MTQELASGVHPRRRRLPLLEANAQAGPTQTPTGTARRSLYPLGHTSRSVLRTLVASLCPPEPAPRDAQLLERVADGAQRIMRHMHPAVSRALAAGLWLLDWAPVLLLRRPQRLHELEPVAVNGLLETPLLRAWTPTQTLMSGLRSLVLGVYFDQPEVHAAIGYAPEAHVAERIARRREHMEREALDQAG